MTFIRKYYGSPKGQKIFLRKTQSIHNAQLRVNLLSTLRESSYRYYSCQSFQEMCWNGLHFMTRTCLPGRAFKCVEGYSVTKDNYSKAFQDLINRFGRKRLLANELVKSILILDVPEKADGKSLRDLYDTLRNRMRSLESLGLKPDDNPSLSMVLLPIFDTKLPRELKGKWELELTKYETEEEDKEINLKKFFQFLEGHVPSKEDPDDTKGSLPKHKQRNGRDRKSKNPADEGKMSAQSLVDASDYKRMKCGFWQRVMRQQSAQLP